MNKISLAIAGLLVAASPVFAVSAADEEDGGQLAFVAAGRDFTLTVPAGYCRPRGADIARARAVAAVDSINFTPVDLQKCGTVGSDYVLLKYPRTGGSFAMTRPEFLALLKAEFEGPNGMEGLAEGAAQANSDIAEASGGSMKVEMPDYGYSGQDDVCVYMSGAVAVTSDTGTRNGIAASCITLIDGQNMVVHVYDFAQSSGIAALKARSAAVARSIQPQ